MAKYKANILSVSSIEQLKKDLQNYKNSLQSKTDLFVQRLTEAGIKVVESKISEAAFTVDEKGIQSGSDTSHYTYARFTNFGDYSRAVLTVEGEELLFIEFGSGVKHNGSAGQSPHPKGQEFGYVIGSYGQGNGQKDTWGYYSGSGELVLTHGTKATMPMYNAKVEIVNTYVKIAKEVFS